MTSPNFMYCGDDEEILSALCAADAIAMDLSFKNTKSDPNFHDSGLSSCNSNNIKYQLNDITENITYQSATQELDDVELDTLQKDNVYLELLKSISSIQVMCNLCLEKSRNLRADYDEVKQDSLDYSKQVMSTQILSENLEKMTSAFNHMSSIAKQCSNLKQVLRNGLSQKSLFVNPSNHKSVIEFFNLTKEIMDTFTEDVKNIKACLSSNNHQQYNVQLQLKIDEHLENVARKIDNMVELRNILGVSQPDPLSKENENPGVATFLSYDLSMQQNLPSLDSTVTKKEI